MLRVLIFVFFAVPAGEVLASDCEFHFEPHRGRVFRTPKAQVEYLGGGANGNVFRMNFSSQATGTVKRYKWERSREVDVEGFLFRRQIAASDIGVRVIDFFDPGQGRNLYIENVYGQTLDQFLSRRDIDPDDKFSFFLRYADFLQRVSNRLEDEYAFQVMAIPHPFALMGGLPLSTIRADVPDGPIIVIKPENVVVDAKNFDLVFIDPN